MTFRKPTIITWLVCLYVYFQNLYWHYKRLTIFISASIQFSSVAHLSDSLWLHEAQHTRPPCPSPTPGVHPNPWPSSRWCHPTISSSVIPFSSCPQSFPESGSFPMSQFFVSGGQSIGVSASTSVLLTNTQDWSPLGWTGCISLQSKELLKTSLNATYHLILTLTLSVDIYFQQSVIMYTWLSSSLSGPMIA